MSQGLKKPLEAYINRTEKPEPVTIRAPKAIWQVVEKLAKEKKCSLNQLVVACIKRMIHEEKGN